VAIPVSLYGSYGIGPNTRKDQKASLAVLICRISSPVKRFEPYQISFSDVKIYTDWNARYVAVLVWGCR
jgi:hypothetical protein